jgi:Ca2+-binding EF-hand superfamily protein
MLRWLYIQLLWLHPPRFRARFGDEMLAIFDQAAAEGSAMPLLLDGVLSLGRQRLFRPAGGQAVARPAAGGVAMFWQSDPDAPRRSSLASGAIGAVATFMLVSYLIAQRGLRSRLHIGSHHPSPSHFLGVTTTAKPMEELAAEVKLKPYPEARRLPDYFRIVIVLAALDLDRDGTISSSEMGKARAALESLDKNRDGKLIAEECGAFFGLRASPGLVSRGRLAFMKTHPVLAVLDLNHDGEISRLEMRGAARNLPVLDRDRDGRLTEAEVRPDPLTGAVLRTIAALDADNDGRVSSTEWASSVDRAMLEQADRNRDGAVDEDELMSELMRRAPPRR